MKSFLRGLVCVNQNDRLLFLKYAIPCATTLVKRKSLPENEFEKLVLSVSNQKVPAGEPEKIFKVAFALCFAKAVNAGSEIDSKIIRDYFWFAHDAVVDERFELMRDFDPKKCKTRPGIISKTSGESVRVKTSLGENEFKSGFLENPKKGDFVVVHRDFAVEIVDKKTAEKIAQKTKKFYA